MKARQPSNYTDWSLGTSTALFETVSHDTLNDALKAGLTHLEIVMSAGDPNLDRCASIAAGASELGMTIHSVHLPYGRAWDPSTLDVAARTKILDSLTSLLKEAAAWQPRVAVIHPSFEPIAPGERSERLAICADALANLGEVANGLGMQLCVECLPRTCLGNTSSEILQIISGTEHLAVCCDVNHLLYERPEEFIRDVGHRIHTLHISDYDGVDERHWMPGRGVIDWLAVVDALASVGYDGPFLFEVTSKPGEARVEPRHLSEWWENLLQQARRA